MPVLNRLRINRLRKTRRPVASRKEPPAETVAPSAYFSWKGLFDRTVAVVLLVPGLVVIGVLAVLVRMTSRGPAIYRQTRVGKDEKPFWMYKIRTMRHDAEATLGATWTRPQDDRITPLGQVLRKLHLDEFPQLINVLRGDMSLVGPRPERPEFVVALAELVPGYRRRLAVRPGITGLAQINLPPDTDLASVQCKLILDIEYVERASFFLDVRMLLCTAVRLVGLPGVYAMRLFALEREVILETPPAPMTLSPDTLQRLQSFESMTAAELAQLAGGKILRPGGNGEPHGGNASDHASPSDAGSEANGNGHAAGGNGDNRDEEAEETSARPFSYVKPR